MWRRHRYSKKADVWSLGVLLYEMAALKRPFAGDTMLKLFDRIMTGKYDPLPECFSPDLCDLVDSILVFDPEARPATGDILRNKYMQFVMTQFERTISSGANQFSDQEKQYILSAVADARNSVAGPPPPMPTGPQRNVVKKSIVLKQSANMWKQRYLIFDGSVLTVSAVEQTVGQTRNLELRDIETVNVSTPEVSRQNCFTIVLSSEHGGQVHFQERSAEEAAIWVNVLNRALEEHQKQKAVNDSAEMLRERVPDRALQPDSPTNMDGEAPGPFPTLGGPTLDSLSPSAGPNAAAADAAPAAEAAPTA
uniref:non-specific serine/threonine protein kinase n=1 Tax=Neobodo designis TaxID=312471 RepID=A0A7S1Q2N7_NEODS